MGAFLHLHAPALVIAVPLFAGFAAPLVARAGRTARNLWVLVFMSLTAAVGLLLAYRVYTGGTAVYVFGAASASLVVPPDSGGIPVRILFAVDAMSALMVVIVSVVGLAITVYSLASEARHSGLDGFYALLFLLVAGILGMVCTGDLFNFFVFLEITSLAGAALTAFRVDKGVAAEAGLKYALVSTLGALLVLIGTAVLYSRYNALNMAELARRIGEGGLTNLDKTALAFFVAALATKCGAVPMHFWAPDTYTAAPSSITALLVASTQASLYGLFRVVFTLFGTAGNAAVLGGLLIALSLLTMFVGVTMAIPQRDIKRLMAYGAVSQTGYMLLGGGVALAALGRPDLLDACGRTALHGGLFQILNGALYEALLFLTAGAVFYAAGTRNLNHLGGLGHSMKWTMLFFIVGALAIVGMPPLNGFASKLMIYESTFKFSPFLTVAALLVSALTLAPFVKVFHSAFIGPRLPRFAQVREAPAPMLLAMAALAVLVVGFGLVPAQVVERLIEPAAAALLDRAGYIRTVLGGP